MNSSSFGPMNRIMIIGCGCSGKTTLSLRLGEILSIPVCHLDRHYWQPGWKTLPESKWRPVHQDLCQGERWIIDGNYYGTMEKRMELADTVIYLDLPTAACLLGYLGRMLKYRGGNRPDISEGCSERLDWGFIRWISAFRRRVRPGIMELIARLGSDRNLVILRSRREINIYLKKLAASKGDGPTFDQ